MTPPSGTSDPVVLVTEANKRLHGWVHTLDGPVGARYTRRRYDGTIGAEVVEADYAGTRFLSAVHALVLEGDAQGAEIFQDEHKSAMAAMAHVDHWLLEHGFVVALPMGKP